MAPGSAEVCPSSSMVSAPASGRRRPRRPGWCDSRTGFWIVHHKGARYFLCEIISEDPHCRQLIEERTVHNAVKSAVARIHGDFGLACCSIAFAVKYLNAYTGVVLLCCRKDFYRLLWSALPFITHLENKSQRYPCSVNVLHLGATIRTCQKFLIQYNRDQLLSLLQNCTSEDRRAIQESVKSCVLVGEQPLQSMDEESDESMETA
ncbi:ribonuclease P/MRP protein subunit POP5 isoform X2 [Varanus komodoensis]|uniref:ribonuclease P/MRP protein subunit POP5 isoform X2 n=1 Tax=Varanus komodoensis TaxID=61221 RepID=UPI001CF776C5|nr:ribonuclease P/MRP protein subunit POP5 isoform X2 [Varanus komodoensis]